MNDTSYVPVKEDFQFLPERDITTDQNFASQGYWKGVAISFFRNKRAVVGLVIVLLIIFLAALGPVMNAYTYDGIVSVINEEGRQIVARGIGPQISGVINGIGKLMVDAITGEGVDYNYVLALGILYSALYIGIMLVVDLLYGLLDPRIRVAAKGDGS